MPGTAVLESGQLYAIRADGLDIVSGSCDVGSGCNEMVLCDETIMMTPLFDVISRCDPGEFSQLTRDLRLRRLSLHFEDRCRVKKYR